MPGTPWGLVTEISWNALLRASQGYRLFLLLLLGLGIVIPAIVVAIGVGRITKPIVELTDAARQVAEGNFGQTVTAATGDELEDLAQQFNRMSAELAESYAQLRKRQERLEFVMEWTNDGIWDWDLKTNEVYFSPRWKSILGYQDHEIANQFDEWQQPHSSRRCRAGHGDRAGLPGTVDTPMYSARAPLAAQGWLVPVDFGKRHRLRDADGKPYRLAGSHTDITERKQAKRRCRYPIRRWSSAWKSARTNWQRFNAIAAVVSRSLDLKEIMRDALDKMMEIIGMEHGIAYRLEGEEGDSTENAHLRVIAYCGFPDEFAHFGDGLPYTKALPVSPAGRASR